MDLRQVFQGLSDAIIVFNDKGVVTFTNDPAEQLIDGKTVKTLGLAQVSQMMDKVIQGEIKTPLRFEIFSDNYARHQVFINKLSSLYVVSLTTLKTEPSFVALKKKTMLLLRDRLNQPLSELSDNLSQAAATMDAPLLRHKLNQMQGRLNMKIQQLQHHVKEIDTLFDLYTTDAIEAFSNVTPLTIIKAAAQEVEPQLKAKSSTLFVRKRRNSRALLQCKTAWMILAFSECIRHVVKEAQHYSNILVTMALHDHFLTVRIGAIDSDSPLPETEGTWVPIHPKARKSSIKQPIYNANLDLSLAERIIFLHQGNLKSYWTDEGTQIVIELPVGEVQQHNSILMQQQSYLYARELAQLRAIIKEQALASK